MKQNTPLSGLTDALERKLAVILHADVVGSTELVQRNETLAHQRIKDTFNRFSETIRSYRGTIHEIRGDALVAEFPRASDAVSAALVFQQANGALNELTEEDISPSVRVGISLGEVVIADGTVTGPGVVLAQRVEQLAKPGGVSVTAAIHEAAPSRLPFDYLDVGSKSVKGFDEPIRVYAVALRADVPIPAPEPVVRSATEISKVKSSRRRRLWFAIASAFIVASGVALLFFQETSVPEITPARPEKMALALPEKPSIAVLPFQSIGADARQTELVDGLSETLVSALGAVPSLFVIASSSTAQYGTKTVEPKNVSEEHGVRYVLRGQVQWNGEQMRVTVQLVDAIHGSITWSERYDRETEDYFKVQDDIVQRILAEVEGELAWVEAPNLWAGLTGNLDAYLHHQRGLKALLTFTPEGIRTARDEGFKAVGFDPNFAAGWSLLGWVEWNVGRLGWLGSGEGSQADKWALAEQHARKSIALAPNYGSPRGLLAAIQVGRQQYEEASASCQQAADLAPNEALLLATCARVFRLSGKLGKALAMMDRAIRINPRFPPWFLWTKGTIQLLAGDHKGAISSYESGQRKGSLSVATEATLAAAYQLDGQFGKVAEIVERLMANKPDITAEKLASENLHVPNLHKHLVQLYVDAGFPQ